LNINPQVHLENRWYGVDADYSGAAALNEGDDQITVQNQLYRVNQFLPPSIDLPNIPFQIWFEQESIPTSLAPCSIENFPIPNDEEYKKRIANGTAISGDYALIREGMSQRSLYRDLERSATPTQWADEIALFHQSANEGKIGAFYAGRNELQKVNDHTDLSTWKNLWSEKRSLLPRLVRVRQEYNNDPSTINWMTYQDEKTNLELLNQDIIQEWENIRQEKNLQLNAVEALNNALTTEIDPQWNEKEVNAILVKVLLDPQSVFSSQDVQLLQQIGEQCPLAGGHAVYQARSLYQLIDRNYQFSNSCDPGTMLRTADDDQVPEMTDQTSTKVSKEESFLVFPNPADDLLNINTFQAGQIQLLNALGGVVKTLETISEAANYNLSLSSLPEGLYYIRFQVLDGSIQTKRIIVHH